jgi:hydroxyethylthiazole kinase
MGGADRSAGIGTPERAAGARLAQMREEAPLVQCITNFVAMNFAANALIAAGAAPAMVHAAEEAGEFARIASALTINIGTLSPDWLLGMEQAARAATGAGVPWVLDPVAVGATSFRREATARLLRLKPAAIRGNASEIIALAGSLSAGRGVDARDPVEAAEGAARRVAEEHGAVVAVTGATDFVTDGSVAMRIEGGHALMPRVTAMGCALTAVTGAFLAGADDRLDAVTAALALFAAAGAEAGGGAAGPGSFVPRFLDALAASDADSVARGARIERA